MIGFPPNLYIIATDGIFSTFVWVSKEASASTSLGAGLA
jgi:hypothetical protein